MVKKTIKKITPRKTEEVAAAVEAVPEPVHGSSNQEEVSSEAKQFKKRGCAFCESKKMPSYLDLVTLKRFVSDRSKILPKTYTHLCAKHQRAVTKNIKYARHLALLPFTPKV